MSCMSALSLHSIILITVHSVRKCFTWTLFIKQHFHIINYISHYHFCPTVETPIALTKFDNPVYNMSEDYIYPVTTNKEDVEIQYDYMCPKQCIKDDIAIYYTKPIGRSDDDYDDCYENLSGGLKNTITKDDDKNNASLSSTSNQYQGLERKTINYLSIYDMLKNKDYSRSNSEENIQSSIIQPPTAILHSNVDREYDYVNIKK